MPFNYQRFEENMNNRVDGKKRNKVLQGLLSYETLTTPVQTAQWINQMMDQLASAAGDATARDVMEACGQRCIGQSILSKAKNIQLKSHDLDDLLDRLNEAHIGGGKMFRTDEGIHASYERCYCGSVSKTRQPISPIYCQCSCGWYKKLFETILDKPVKVELLDSIIHGAHSCQFVIHI